MKKIGLGCFHFKAKEFIPIDNYIEYLKEDLDKITNISNLKFEDIENGWKSGFLPINDNNIEKYNFDDATGYYPSFYSGKISFDIIIPKKAQQEAYSEYMYYKNNEDFKVEIFFDYMFTYTIIEPKNIQKEEGASLSIVLVREFLIKELKNIKDCRFELEILGPSPFHADFEIELMEELELNNKYKDSKKSKIFMKIIPTRSYDLIQINGLKSDFKNDIDFKMYIEETLSREFSLLYLQVLAENYKMILWNKIDQLMIETKNNFSKHWWEFKYSTSSKTEKLFIKLVEYKHYNISFDQTINEEVNKIKREYGDFHLIEFIENKDEIVEQKSIDNVSDLINFFDKKQSSKNNNYYLGFVNIISATLGFLLSFLLKK